MLRASSRVITGKVAIIEPEASTTKAILLAFPPLRPAKTTAPMVPRRDPDSPTADPSKPGELLGGRVPVVSEGR